MALCNAASVTTKSAVSMINFITNKSKWADCSKHYETELIFCVLDGQLTMTLPFSWTPQPVTQWTKKGVTRYYQHSQSPHTKILNAIGCLQLAPLWPDCYVMCRLREPKCSPVLRSFLALTCMVPGRGGSSSPWRGVPSWCFSSQERHFNSGGFHWRALDVGCHARKWNTERKQALSKESNSFWFYFNLSNSLLLV